jgi:hypothetical protein
LDGEAVASLEGQASVKRVTAKQTAAILRKLKRGLSQADLTKMAAGIETARRKMSDEHLY